MKIAKAFVLIAAVSLVLLNTGLSLGQEPVKQLPAQQANNEPEPEPQWLWGEVVSVDTQKKEILVKYLDYETDNEKEAVIKVDGNTTCENIKDIAEIKPQDTLSADFIVTADGANIARSISVEKPEDTELPKEGVGAGNAESVPVTP